MRKQYKTDLGIDIYIDLDETSYHDPETQKWLWEECNVIYSGLNTSPLMFFNGKVIIGWEDDGHLFFGHDSLALGVVYFKSLLRDGQKLVKNLERRAKDD